MLESFIHRKDSIVLTAIEIIDDMGIQGLSTREIAKRQQISEGTIFKHFRNKNEIILEVLKSFSKYDSDIFQTIEIRKMNFSEGMRYMIGSYAEFYTSYPAITSLVNGYEVFRWDPVLEEEMKYILKRRFEFICSLIQLGRGMGELSEEVDVEGLAYIIGGIFNTITLRWRMTKYSFDLKERMISTLEIILKKWC